MSTIYNVAGTSSSGSTNNTNSTSSSSTTLDKNAFLQLMIAQMKNQDPLSPMDNSQMVAQLATFSTLEQLTNMASDIAELKESLVTQNSQSLLTQGAALIGKDVTYYGSDGKETSGTVTSVKWSDGSLSLMVGETELAMEDVLELKNA